MKLLLKNTAIRGNISLTFLSQLSKLQTCSGQEIEAACQKVNKGDEFKWWGDFGHFTLLSLLSHDVSNESFSSQVTVTSIYSFYCSLHVNKNLVTLITLQWSREMTVSWQLKCDELKNLPSGQRFDYNQSWPSGRHRDLAEFPTDVTKFKRKFTFWY